jgi:uncharacterized coiled-coil protein SlyX
MADQTEEQLKKQLAALQEKLKKIARKAKAAKAAWKPPFDGAHRGY